MADEIKDAIVEQAVQPQSSTVDGVSVNQRPLKDMIEADKYTRGQDAVVKPTRGLRFTRFIPPGPGA